MNAQRRFYGPKTTNDLNVMKKKMSHDPQSSTIQFKKGGVEPETTLSFPKDSTFEERLNLYSQQLTQNKVMTTTIYQYKHTQPQKTFKVNHNSNPPSCTW
jgi:hypothetical protein